MGLDVPVGTGFVIASVPGTGVGRRPPQLRSPAIAWTFYFVFARDFCSGTINSGGRLNLFFVNECVGVIRGPSRDLLVAPLLLAQLLVTSTLSVESALLAILAPVASPLLSAAILAPPRAVFVVRRWSL